MGFKTHTSQFTIEIANESLLLEGYSKIFRKETQTEKEQNVLSLILYFNKLPSPYFHILYLEVFLL